MNKSARELLINLYLEFWNDFLTVACFAEYHGLTKEEGQILVDLARKVYNHPRPEY